jgi:hypothetical protein
MMESLEAGFQEALEKRVLSHLTAAVQMVKEKEEVRLLVLLKNGAKLFPLSFEFVESFWVLPRTPLDAAIETTRPDASSTPFKGLIRPFDPAACIVHCLFPVSLVPTNTVCAFTIAGQEGKACCSPGEEGCIKI